MSEQNNETLIPLYEPIDNAPGAARLDVPALLSAASSDSDAADYSDIASVPTMRVSNTASSVLTESTLPSATTSTDNDVTMTTYEQPSTDGDRADGPVDVDSSEESLLASPDVSFDADEQPPTTPEMILLQISEGDDMPAWNPLVPDDFDSINSQVSDVTGGSDGQLPGAVPSSADTADDIVRDLTAAEHNTNDDNNKEELYGYPHYMGAMSDAPSDAEPLEKHDIETAPKEFKLTEHPDDVETGAQSPKANDAKAQHVPAPMYHREGSPTPSMLTICSCFLIVILIMAVLGLTFSLVQANKQNSILQSQVNGTSSSISPTAKVTFKPTAAPSPSPKPTLRPTRVPTTPAPTTPAPTVLDVYEKAQLLRDFVIEQNFSKANRFDNVDSPQSRALFFMIQDDLVDLPVPIPRSTISQETIVQWRQRYVMSLFYYALMGDDWTLKLNFVDHTLPTCSWNQNFTFPGGQVTTLGVLCDNDARVDAIRIVRNNLIGSLPAELGLLTDLTSLNWEQNTIIIGTIPSALSNLNALQQFSCLYCTLTGKIPDWIGTGWPQLNVLGLSQNTMTGSVPSSIAELTKLAILGLDDNLMTGTLDVLHTMPMLEQVYLDNNEFVGNLTATFLESATRLRTLDISGNQMMGSVPVHLMTRKYFKILDLHDNQLTIFEDAIPENSSLSLLALHGNPFEGTVPSSMSNLRSLTHLDLTSTTFTGTMPELVGNELLSYLFIANTKFDKGTIPDSYQSLTNLVDLSLAKSLRTGTIPSWVDDLDQLILLDLHSNSLTGTIPSGLAGMQSIEFLLLNRNELSGEIPTNLAFAELLQIIYVDNNSLNGTLNAVCDAASSLLSAASDCAAPEISCRCCNVCCDDDVDGCNDRDAISQYDPQWEGGFKRSTYDFNKNLGT